MKGMGGMRPRTYEVSLKCAFFLVTFIVIGLCQYGVYFNVGRWYKL